MNRLDKIEKELVTLFNMQRSTQGDDALMTRCQYLLDRCRKLEKVAKAARTVVGGRVINEAYCLNMIIEGPERTALLEALKELEGGE